MLLGGVMLLALGTVTGEWQRLSFTPRTAGAMIYLVLVGSIVGYSAYVYALKYLAIATVSLSAYAGLTQCRVYKQQQAETERRE